MTKRPKQLTLGAVDLALKILAGTDAVWLPFRDSRAAWWPGAWEKRRAFASAGIVYGSGGQTSADWQAAVRAKAELIGRGFLVEIRPRGARTTGVRLTDGGDHVARHLAGLFFCPIEFTREVADLVTHPESTRAGWAPEILLNGGRGWGDGCERELLGIEDIALPALVRGLVESKCDTVGRVYYKVTPAGRKILASPREPAASIGLAALPDGRDRYDAMLQIALDALHAPEKRGRDIGPCALPGSMERNGGGPET